MGTIAAPADQYARFLVSAKHSSQCEFAPSLSLDQSNQEFFNFHKVIPKVYPSIVHSIGLSGEFQNNLFISLYV